MKTGFPIRLTPNFRDIPLPDKEIVLSNCKLQIKNYSRVSWQRETAGKVSLSLHI